jgi:hypothetical protein
MNRKSIGIKVMVIGKSIGDIIISLYADMMIG